MGMDKLPDADPMENHPTLAGLDPADLLRQGAAEDTMADGASASFTPPPLEEIATHFPQFEILELIGQGGMGAVYKVRQKDLDRVVALKILPPAIGQSPEFSKRFTREARALAKLNHPGIVTLHEFGQQNGLSFILMEFVDGVNLAQLMKTGRISPREALAIVPQICDALQYAHDQGIVHRDIKPENLLLDRAGRVKVADFGIAKVVAAVSDPIGSGDTPVPTEATLHGKIIGTPQYMAPEQITHPSEVDHRADIYALGVVFYQMLTGELPDKRLQAPSRKVQIDVRLDEIVLKAMEKNPELRYQQASVMKTRVGELKTFSTVGNREKTRSVRHRIGAAEEKMSFGKKAWLVFWCLLVLWPAIGVSVSLLLFWLDPAVMSSSQSSPHADTSDEPNPNIPASTPSAGPAQVWLLERGELPGGVDLDTGGFVNYKAQGGIYNPAGASLWREENGIDLVLNHDSRRPGVLVAGIHVKEVATEWWDDPPEAGVVEAVLPPWEKKALFDERMTSLAAAGPTSGTRTHVYRTLAGSVGILRLGPTHTSSGVRVKWRMVVERNPVYQTTTAAEATADGPQVLMTEFGEFKSEQSLWSIRVSAQDRTLHITRQPGSSGIGMSMSQSKWRAQNGWFAFIEDENHAWAYDGGEKLMLAEVTPEKSTLYETETIPRSVPDEISSRISEAVMIRVGTRKSPKVVLATPASPQPEVDSIANQWLSSIDAGNYAQSWINAAVFFQKSLTEDAWVTTLTQVRKPLGALKTRELRSSKAATSLPGAPDGEYVVMEFETSFSAKETAGETVTFMKEADGSWKAAGYFIR